MALERIGLNRLKGVSQGCPLSPYLFILLSEILSNKIRQDPNIKGIKIYGNEMKLSQFADDTTLFNADLASLERALKIIHDFGRIAGLSLNVKKTKAIWLGKWANNREIKFDVTWSYVKRQTAKVTSGFVFFSSNPSLNRIKK